MKNFKLPKRVKICGYDYEITTSNDRLKETGHDRGGSSYTRWQKIWIDKKQHPEQILSAFIHEVLEVIEWHNELKLPHETISKLEQGIFSFLKDNKFL